MEQIASDAGAKDVFVLKRVEDDHFFNLGGFGRGAGWAGNVTIEASSEPWVTRALEEGIARKRSGVPFRVFGPYWAKEAVAVTSDNNLIVLGGEGVGGISDDDLMELARRAADSAPEMPPAKREADEAEVQQALDQLLGFKGASVEEAAVHVASTTARALSCEFGAVLLLRPQARVFMADEGWRPVGTDDELIAALLPLHQIAQEGTYVEQDLTESPFPFPPLSYDDGLVARCCVPLGTDGRLGMIFTAHAGRRARGFTSLCRRVASTMGEASSSLLE